MGCPLQAGRGTTWVPRETMRILLWPKDQNRAQGPQWSLGRQWGPQNTRGPRDHSEAWGPQWGWGHIWEGQSRGQTSVTQGAQQGLMTTMGAQGPKWGPGIQGGLSTIRGPGDHKEAWETHRGPGPQWGLGITMGPGSHNGEL